MKTQRLFVEANVSLLLKLWPLLELLHFAEKPQGPTFFNMRQHSCFLLCDLFLSKDIVAVGGGRKCYSTVFMACMPCFQSIANTLGSVVTKVCLFIYRDPTAGASWSTPGAPGESQPAATTAASEKEKPDER